MIGNIQDMNTKLVFKFKLQNSFMYYDLDVKLKKKLWPLQWIDQKWTFWYFVTKIALWEKNVLVIEKFFWNSRLEGQEFAKLFRSPEQFIQTVKGQNNIW